MSLNVDGAFIYFTIPIFGGIPITQTTVSFFVVALCLIIASVGLGRNLKKRPTGVQVLVEKGVMMLKNMVVETMGPHNAHWTPFIGTIFLSSIFGSFIGLTGFLRSSTADLSCTIVWALMVTAIIWYNNIKNNGFLGWLKGFTAGFLTTCGLDAVGNGCEDDGEVTALHGKVGNIPAEHIYWDEDEDNIWVKAVINHSQIFQRKLRLTRVISCSKHENTMSIQDTIENVGDTQSPLMVLYHMNMGYPLLSETTEPLKR